MRPTPFTALLNPVAPRLAPRPAPKPKAKKAPAVRRRKKPAIDTEFALVGRIVRRASRLYRAAGINRPRVSIALDILGTHLRACPLDLVALANADDARFMHDIIGIRHHIDRDAWRLMDCFVPMFAKEEANERQPESHRV